MVQAIIMAGGEGSRLRPLTCDRPKPMVPMVNRPVMEHTVELLKEHGITDIGVTLQYMPQEIISYFGDGSRLGVSMNYFIEETPLGTAGSVKNSGSFLKDTFVVISGDALTDFNLSEAIDYHRAKGAVATLVLTPVEIPLEYGVVITAEDGKIRQFLEKPGWGEVFSDTVNTGIYILEPEVLDLIPEGKKFDFSQELFPLLLNNGEPLFGVSLNGYWCDIGNLKQYQEAQFAAIDGKVRVKIPGEMKKGQIFIGKNCRIDETADIKGPVIIGDNCLIGKNSVIGPQAVLGDNCRVDNGATIKRSVVWNGTYIGKQAEIRGAVLCSKVLVKDRAAVFEGAVIGDEGILEEDVKVKADTKIWPGKLVEKGSVLDSHLIWGTKACKNLFGSEGISGTVNHNLTPECAAKIGAVYGSVAGSGSKILVTCDGQTSSQMIKSAVQAGLMSVGITILDGGSVVTPIHKYSVKSLEADGGIHIKASSNEPDVLNLNFFESDGSVISRGKERKIENLFEREDFQRSGREDIGTVSYIPGLKDAYMRFLVNNIDTQKISASRLKTVLYATPKVSGLMNSILSLLGCSIENIPTSRLNPELPADRKSLAELTAVQVVNSSSNLGIVLDKNAELVSIIDEQGRIIKDELLQAIIAAAYLDSSQQPVVAVPVTGSGVIEIMAEKRNGKVIRTKTSPVALMKETLKPDVVKGQGMLNQSTLIYDAISTTVKIIEYMALKQSSLGQIVDEIPEFHMIKKETDCPWTAKGKVIRRLIEENQDKKVELMDGIKVYHDNGWALVLPDAEQPRYNVFSEAFSYEFAESLADFYIQKINQLQTE